MSTWAVDGDASSVEVAGRSSLHPVHGRLRPGALSGTVEATVCAGELDLEAPTSGHLEFPLAALSFGNAMYDRELPRRLDTARFPTVALDLQKARSASGGQLQLELEVAVHGAAIVFEEAARCEFPEPGVMVVSGHHLFDVRQFNIEPPRMLGMKVHPDFTVTVAVTARRAGQGDST